MKDSKDTRNRFKMREKVVTALCTILLLSMAMGTMMVQAANRETLLLKDQQQWRGTFAQTRTMKDNYIDTKLYAATPYFGGVDGFYKVRTCVMQVGTGKIISEVEEIFESVQTYTHVTIYNGYLDLKEIRIAYSAPEAGVYINADVEYDAR